MMVRVWPEDTFAWVACRDLMHAKCVWAMSIPLQVMVSNHLSGAFTVTDRWARHFLPTSKPFGKQHGLTHYLCVHVTLYLCVLHSAQSHFALWKRTAESPQWCPTTDLLFLFCWLNREDLPYFTILKGILTEQSRDTDTIMDLSLHASLAET